MVPVAVEAHARQIVDHVADTRGPHGLFRGVGGREAHDDEIPEFEGVAFGVRKPGVEHKLKLEAGTAVGQLTLQQVFVRKAARVRGRARKAGIFHEAGQDERGQAPLAVVGELVRRGIAGGPDTQGIAPVGQRVIQALLGLRGAEIGDLAARLENGVELLDGLREFVTHHLRIGVVGHFDVVRDDLIGPASGDLREDALGGHGWGVVGFGRCNVEGELGAALIGAGDETSQGRDFIDQAQAEGGEVVGPVFGGREDHEFPVGVETEFPDNIRGRDPAFAHAPEGFNDFAPGAALQVGGDVDLHGRGVGKAEVLPDQDQKGPEVAQRVRQRRGCRGFQKMPPGYKTKSPGTKNPDTESGRRIPGRAGCRNQFNRLASSSPVSSKVGRLVVISWISGLSRPTQSMPLSLRNWRMQFSSGPVASPDLRRSARKRAKAPCRAASSCSGAREKKVIKSLIFLDMKLLKNQ